MRLTILALLAVFGCGDANQKDTADPGSGVPMSGVGSSPTSGTAGGTPTGPTGGTTSTGTPTGTATTPPPDADGDGYDALIDCDDGDPTVFPGAPELCDGVDTDCDLTTEDLQLVTLAAGNYPSVQQAIDASVPGDVVWVCPGTYNEAVVVAHDLEIAGVGTADTIVLDAQQGGPAVRVDAGAVVLSNLTVTGGTGVDVVGTLVGGGVAASGATSLSVLDCVVDGNTADVGAGIHGSELGATVIERTVVSNNVAADEGGGVVLGVGTVLDSLFVANEANRGGGGLVLDMGAVDITGTDFDGNHAVDRGGAMWVLDGAALSLDGGLWVGNTSDRYAAGVYLDQNSNLTAIDTTFDNNAAVDKGGAIYASGAAVDVTSVVFLGNSGSWGGVAMVFFNSTFSALDTQMSFNSATQGGALYINLYASALLTDSVVEGSVTQSGGGAWLSADVSLESVNTDWGTGALENVPDDINFAPPGGEYTAFGAGETFLCSTTTNLCQ